MLINRETKSTIAVFLMILTNISHASESYFAQDLVRGFFSIRIEKPILHENTKGKSLPTEMPDRLSFLIWNIHKGVLFGEKPLSFPLKGYDFLLFQENVWEWSLRNLDYEGHHYFVPTFTIDKNLNGLSIIITRYKPKKTQIFHTRYSEPLIISPKSFMVADYGDLLVINVHSLNFVTYKEWLYELKRVFDLIKDHPQIVLAGDFNTWSEERLMTLKEKVKALGLQEIVFKNDHRTKVLGLSLDWVFTKGFNVKDAQVIPLPDYSDHSALEVTLERIPN